MAYYYRQWLLVTSGHLDHSSAGRSGGMVKSMLKSGHAFSETAMHTPMSVTDRAIAYTTFVQADSIALIGAEALLDLARPSVSASVCFAYCKVTASYV